MGYLARQLAGATDPARDAGWQEAPERKGFFTDTSICIGCKACEVACKEWNGIPLDGLAITGSPAQIRAFVRQIIQVLDDYTPTAADKATTDTGWIHTKTGETCADPFMCHHGHTSAR